MIIIKIKDIFYIITPSYMFRLPLSEPKRVAGSSNVKHVFNFNNNHQLSCVTLYIL
jgi:hypothetical protein